MEAVMAEAVQLVLHRLAVTEPLAVAEAVSILAREQQVVQEAKELMVELEALAAWVAVAVAI
jgi:hypothetical protein